MELIMLLTKIQVKSRESTLLLTELFCEVLHGLPAYQHGSNCEEVMW